ncbi:MAG TPA: GIY-YIG nuclease family protein [Bryobacteraceae bacterium]
MGSNVNRKEAAKAFKARKVPKGIFAIRCRITGAVWVDSSPNLGAARNGAWFQLRCGLHRDKRLQEEWNACGEEAFDFAVLETLDDDLSLVEIPDILQDKKHKWATEVSGHAL